MLVGARPGRLRAMHTTTLSGALRSEGFTGRVVEPGDAGYDTARAGWNGAIDRFPSAVAYASDADDVAAAIRLGVPFTIRGGGHSVSGPLGARRRAVHRPARAELGRRSTRRGASCGSAAARC